jgi:antitoxin (DNA-binding transcriptional repressor) of toxin-antitoxin stability system
LEEFIVTKFGKPKAMLVPVTKTGTTNKGSFDEVFGVWKNRIDIETADYM